LKTPQKKTKPRPTASTPATAFEKAWSDMRTPNAPPATVSGRWLLTAIGIALVGAAFCCWGTLCLLFWQGSWQLLYHPSSSVTRTPASAGIAFDPLAFAASETGQTRLSGWWIPAAPGADLSRFTVLYLHGEKGNLGNAVDALAQLHSVGVNILAFDYRGYGQSQFVRPSEARWREDAQWALEYLTGTRQIPAASIVLDGDGLGADLALEIAGAHPELAGVILRDPVPDAANIIFRDARAQLVPARLLVRDRYDLDAPAATLRMPALWFERRTSSAPQSPDVEPSAFRKIGSRKMLVWLPAQQDTKKQIADSLSRWLGDLH
jgi:uncharacterized protein